MMVPHCGPTHCPSRGSMEFTNCYQDAARTEAYAALGLRPSSLLALDFKSPQTVHLIN